MCACLPYFCGPYHRTADGANTFHLHRMHSSYIQSLNACQGLTIQNKMSNREGGALSGMLPAVCDWPVGVKGEFIAACDTSTVQRLKVYAGYSSFRDMLRHHAINRCSLLARRLSHLFQPSAQQVTLCRGPHASTQDAWRRSLGSYGSQDAISALRNCIGRLTEL